MEQQVLIQVLEEFAGLLQDVRCEIRAISETLVDHQVVTENELINRIKDVRFTEWYELQIEARRRQIAKLWEGGEDLPRQ